MPRMGGLKKYLPTTYKTMLMGWLAICGIIPFAGFFSKDEILWKTFSTSVFGGGWILWLVGFFSAAITAFYMTRLMALTFWGEERFRKVHAGGEADEAYASAHDKGLAAAHDAAVAAPGDRPMHQPGEHVGGHDTSDLLDAHGVAHAHFEPHESPRNMTLPLIVLAVGSVVVGWVGIPHALTGGANLNFFERWLEPVIVKVHEAPSSQSHEGVPAPGVPSSATATANSARGAAHEATDPMEYVLIALSLGIAFGGIFLGRVFYVKRPDLARAWTQKLRPLYTLSFNKWYWDWLLDVKGVQAVKAVDDALWKVDAAVVDGGVNGASWLTRFWARVTGWWDKWVIDLAVNATGFVTKVGSYVLRTVQTGFWQNYALLFALGLFIILVYYVYPAISTTIKGFTGR